jgi:acetylornithine deacetylase/succinyl-diaminopimelate desuccinylase-like protein
MSYTVDWPAVRNEAVALLQRLIQFDTTNPPGNEEPLARYLDELLRAEGIASEVLVSAPGRGNLVARLSGSGSGGGPLALLSHLDVVYADPAEWAHPPFGGEIHDDCIWGRGALDMKSLLVEELMAVLLIRRLGLPLKRDIILIGGADEEASHGYGVRWLVEKHWQKVAPAFVLNEGGGSIRLGERDVFLIGTAEKGYGDVQATAHGLSGHASRPKGDNALATLGRALVAIDAMTPGDQVDGPVLEMMRGMARAVGLPEPQPATWQEGLPALLAALPDPIDDLLRLSLRTVLTPTMLNAGIKENVIPSQAQANINVRPLPSVSQQQILDMLQAASGPKVTFEVKKFSPGTQSPTGTALYEAVASVLCEAAPGAICVPYMCLGGTDSGNFRRRGVPAYGISPAVMAPEYGDGVHGKNERLPLAVLYAGLERIFKIVARVCCE